MQQKLPFLSSNSMEVMLKAFITLHFILEENLEGSPSGGGANIDVFLLYSAKASIRVELLGQKPQRSLSKSGDGYFGDNSSTFIFNSPPTRILEGDMDIFTRALLAKP